MLGFIRILAAGVFVLPIFLSASALAADATVCDCRAVEIFDSTYFGDDFSLKKNASVAFVEGLSTGYRLEVGSLPPLQELYIYPWEKPNDYRDQMVIKTKDGELEVLALRVFTRLDIEDTYYRLRLTCKKNRGQLFVWTDQKEEVLLANLDCY